MKKNFFVVMLLFGLSTIITSCNQEKHEYVDLGLPSGTLWATCDIGAEKPLEHGDRFAWGETTPKEDFSWQNYKFTQTTSPETSIYEHKGFKYHKYEVIKYNEEDGKKNLDLEDDAAHVNWGGKWRIPTLNEWRELVQECAWKIIPEGYVVTGQNGKYIFLPVEFIYWTSNLSPKDLIQREIDFVHDNKAYYMDELTIFYNEYNDFVHDNKAYYMSYLQLEDLDFRFLDRCDGFHIRPVKHKHRIIKRKKNS